MWAPWGTFKPTSIRRGKVSSDISLKVTALDLSWSPPLGTFLNSIATTSPYQLARIGYYDNKKVRVWRTVMPTPGDANTYGAYELFGGRVADTTVGRGEIKFSVNSFLDVINQKVPPNVIENSNTLAGFKGATPVLADGETNIPQFTVVAPSTQTNILADCTSPTPGKIYGNNKFQYGYMVFNPGSTLAGQWSAIANNFNYNPGGGGPHHSQFFVYAGFPWPPSPGDTFYVSTKFPVDPTDSGAGGLGPGQVTWFPFVPSPETAL